MLVPLCNCNRHFSFLPSQTLLNPTFQTPSCHYPNTAFKSLRRRASISAAAASPDSQALPQSAIRRIAEKLRSLGYVEEISDGSPDEALNPGPNSPGEIFVPLRTHLPKHRVGHTLDSSWSTPENPVPDPGSGHAMQRFHELRRGVLEEEEKERIRKRSERNSAPSLAELTLPEEELRRLRSVGIGLKKKLNVGKAGITEGIVNGIHERWRRSEMVRINCEDICRLNMKRTHELLEIRKTGGLVIWRSGGNIILYRGSSYKYPYFLTDKLPNGSFSEDSADLDEGNIKIRNNTEISRTPLIEGVGLPNRVRFQLPGEAQLAEEADAMLEGLGPRFTDWWGYDPLPVDADLLPAVVPGYKRPFRLLPYGVKPKLTNDEMTTLKRLGRPLPCHFALGRNRKHQGLAAAIVKLWEKSEIAKIAIKRGVQNTNSELMAEELKWLTGGTLLSRDKEFIVFYRGKDFLPATVSSAIEERRKYEISLSYARARSNSSTLNHEDQKHGKRQDDSETEHEEEENNRNLRTRSEKRKQRFSNTAMERTSTKLSIALEKKDRAEKFLEELEKAQTPQPAETDKEGITEEERYMLRKVGLRMKPFLLMGRRGVFDGTVENMHLHWKYRELVKVCIGKRSVEEIHGIARTLEAESGGILVAVEPVSKGYAIIVYRGKNYTRPAILRPQTLLSKRAAMKRSLEAQRRQSLKLHVLKLSKNIDELKLKMAKDEDTRDTQLTKDSEIGSVEKELIENHNNIDKIFYKDVDSNHQSYPEDTANEIRKSPETGDADLEDPIHTSEGYVVKGNYLFNKTEQNVEHPRYSQSQYRASSSTTELEPLDQKSKEKPLMTPSLQLSNKERLLLRKQALKMKKIPLLAVGKSNAITGLAKAIKDHFAKHPLAIVNIKGRAKGTSAQEVIYNLEQATGAVLVSQEPSKVILYRGWGFKSEPDQANRKKKYDSMGVEVKARRLISPALKSAMRIECGSKSLTDDIPDDKPSLR
ncbi:hypothetical protein CASFOL_033018 [Castilleja foliolosa]|uniref:CRM domain-containing protein n=1 Tax=Castilleja foliolosa TaxID=1961234 RepID=A0ABD3C3R8_9LAMI